VTAAKKVRLLEVDPHGLMSAEHGQSQQRVTELLCETIPALCEDGLPAIVLLDEVESMAVARSEASLAANPADVHRATDAVLMALDRNADRFPHIVTVATSNFTAALDEAFRSRADLSLEIPLPDAGAAAAILGSALSGFAVAYPALGDLARSPRISALGDRLVGLDGRQIRKLVTEAMAMRREVVIDPGALSLDDLHAAIDAVGSGAEPREVARAAL
jgi:AAA+ superfamily predicted ATPase